MKRKKEPTLKNVMKKAMDEDLQTALALSRSMVEAKKREKAAAKRAAKDCAPLNLLITEEQRDNLIGQRLSRLLFAEIPPSQLQPPPIATELPGPSWMLAAVCESPEAYYVSALRPPIEPCVLRAGDRMLPLSQIPGRDHTFVMEDEKTEEKTEELEGKTTEEPCDLLQTESIPPRSTDLRTNFLAMVGSELCSDASFVLEGSRVPIHRFVLAARCPSLLQLLDGEGRIQAAGVSREVLLRFLRFLYAERVEREGREAVLELFDRWNLEHLKAAFLTSTSEEISEDNNRPTHDSLCAALVHPSHSNSPASLLSFSALPSKDASNFKSPPQDLEPPCHDPPVPLTSNYSIDSPPYLPISSTSNQPTISHNKLSTSTSNQITVSPNKLSTSTSDQPIASLKKLSTSNDQITASPNKLSASSTNNEDAFPTHFFSSSPDKLPISSLNEDLPTPSPHRPLPSPYHHCHPSSGPDLSPPLHSLPSPSPPALHFSPPLSPTVHLRPPSHPFLSSSVSLPPSNSRTESPSPSDRSVVVLDSDSELERSPSKAPTAAAPKISEADLDAAIDKLDAIGLRNELAFYGVRELPRKQAVRVLKTILLEVCRDQLIAAPTTCFPKKSSPKKARKKTYASSAEVIAFVKSDRELYEKIMRYEPVELDFLKARLRAAHVKVKNDELVALLDTQGITFVNNKEEK